MRPLKTFIIYAREDESFKNDLLKHLTGTLVETGQLEVWHDGKILPGEEWEMEINKQLETADLFLVLLSIDALISNFIKNTELKKALGRKSRIVPILVRSCYWEKHPIFAGLQCLPRNERPISDFSYHDDAWTEVIRYLDKLEKSIREMESKLLTPQPVQEDVQLTPPPEPLNLAAQHAHAGPSSLPDMILVNGGTFLMGSPKNEEGRSESEIQHPVMLPAFEMAKYPVTQKLWRDVMGNNPAHFKGKNLPVESVSWNDAQEFLQKLNARFPGHGYRLPTEAEWEYAARGGNQSQGFLYAGSDNLDEVAWYAGNSASKTHPVGQKKANELGLFDMSGNVWEWCADWYGPYPSALQTDPQGPETGLDRIRRGGGWLSNQHLCRVGYRSNWLSDGRSCYVGFRLAASPP